MLSYSDIERYVQLTAPWTLDLWEQFENDWLMNRVVPAAKKNPLYGGAETIRDIQDLAEFPSISWNDIAKFAEKVSLEGLITAEPSASWGSSGSSGKRKIVWSSEDDLDMYRRVFGRRLYAARIGPKARALLLGAPGGYMSGVYSRLGLDWLAEIVSVPFTDMAGHVTKILSGPFDVMVAYPSVAYLLATEDGFKRLTGASQVSDLMAETSHGKLKEGLEFCQVYIGGDFRTQLQDKVLTDFYGRPPCLVYVSTEITTGGCECMEGTTRHHTGALHPAFDDVIPLIIPLAELEKERVNPGYEPKKLLLSKAPAGTVGEAVFTVNANCFVRLNYRTGDMIRKVTDKSDCPTPLPTFEVLGRVFRKVSEPELGLEGYEAAHVKIATAPFDAKYMEEVISMVRRQGRIKDWFMSLSYVQGKPRLTLFIEAEAVKDRVKLVEEIFENIASNIQLEVFSFVTKAGLADMKIEFIPLGTLDRLKEKKLKQIGAGKGTLGQMKIPRLVLTTDFVKEQGLL
jgi:phenylacetate-coenzyme A ligase PaaK-like adenylate-forming protein